MEKYLQYYVEPTYDMIQTIFILFILVFSYKIIRLAFSPIDEEREQ